MDFKELTENDMPYHIMFSLASSQNMFAKEIGKSNGGETLHMALRTFYTVHIV